MRHVAVMTDFISFKTLQRPAKPNTYLLAPGAQCLASEPDAEPPLFDMTPRGLFSKLSELVAATKSWTIVASDAEVQRIKFIAVTPLLRFKDDIDIAVFPVGESQSTLGIYSRSRVGYSDLGANKKRVQQIMSQLTAK